MATLEFTRGTYYSRRKNGKYPLRALVGVGIVGAAAPTDFEEVYFVPLIFMQKSF